MKVLVTGGTGLVGNAALRQALEHPDTSRVVSLGRRRTNLDTPKLTEVVVEDFLDLAPVKRHLHGVGLCLYCLAAYSNRMDRAAYERITVGYLDILIRALQVASPRAAFCLFSAEGARRDGKSWLRVFNVKGRAENCLMAARFPRKYVFRPAYIHPTRPRAHPVFYDPIMKPIFRLFPAVGIESRDLARVMIETGLNDPRPEAVLENREMRAFRR
jgi:uncharacterized protein YbjT (DUF2867 family)